MAKKRGFLIAFISFLSSWLIFFGIYNLLSTIVENLLTRYSIFNVYYQYFAIIFAGVILSVIFGFSLRGMLGIKK